MRKISMAVFLSAISGFSCVAPLPAAFLYVVSPHQNVAGFKIESTGTLTAVPGSPFALDKQTMAVDASGRFAYLVDGENASLHLYDIGSDGSLTFVSSFDAGVASTLTLDPSGKFIYVNSMNTGQIYGFTIGTNGALTAVPGSPYTVGNSAFLIAIEPVREIMYLSSEASAVTTYQINSDGSLSFLQKLASKPPKIPGFQASG